MLIEAIGTPGAGKSTLLKALKQESDLKQNFKTWQNVRVKAIRSFITSKETRQKQWVVFPKNIVWEIPWANDYFANCIFHRFIKHDPLVYKGSWGNLAKLLIEGVMYRGDIKPDLVPYYISWELEKLVTAQIAGHYCQTYNKNIILDEGVLSAINSLNKTPDQVNQSLIPDAVIFVSTEPEDALSGILERKSKDRVNKSQINKDDSAILKFLDDKHKRYINLIQQLESLNTPVLNYNYKNDSLQSLVHRLKGLLNRDRNK